MAGLKTRSVFFRATVIYIFLTVLNVSIFILMVFENQLDLIAENAILSSQHTASSLKYRIDNILGDRGALSSTNINNILKESGMLDINKLTLFSEAGKIYVEVDDNVLTQREMAELEELRMINMAITRQGFEDKLFYHSVDREKRLIQLYIPFVYESEMIGVAGIELEMKDIAKQMGYLYRQCLLVGILVTVLHIGFAFLFTKMILLPLRKINEATKLIAKGDLEIRVPITGSDEFGQLASSFNEMSVSLARMRDEAKGSNPLTGLPGNITIANYIDECLLSGKKICVLYCDLDNFKAYNDKYGFTKGDEAILYTRDCMLTVAKRKDLKNVFVGHEGGDDFVIVCPFEYWETIAKAFITTFDRGIYQFYNSTDARNGCIESVNRLGERQKFPLMSISVAVVTNKTRPFRRHAEMIQVAAEVKKYVKSMDGSCYAIDRRTGPTSPTQIIRKKSLPSSTSE
ncbi:response regulator receiver modulated diguanylate cyclase [Chitinispirillum alkaliphilum]|nr:response regulator receiver modulated diguanylate cyclase [Chitinispirillum alkaliphilum]